MEENTERIDVKTGLEVIERAEDTHVITLFAVEEERFPIIDNFDVPEGYDSDTVVVLPVNRGKLYVYWEISDSARNSEINGKRVGHCQLMMVLYEVKDNDIVEFHCFEVNHKVGSGFVHYHNPYGAIIAVLGFYDKNEFIDIIISKTIASTPLNVADKLNEYWLIKAKSYVEETQVTDTTPQEEVSPVEETVEDIVVQVILPEENQLIIEEVPQEVFPEQAFEDEIVVIPIEEAKSAEMLEQITHEMGLPFHREEPASEGLERTAIEEVTEKDKGYHGYMVSSSDNSVNIYHKDYELKNQVENQDVLEGQQERKVND